VSTKIEWVTNDDGTRGETWNIAVGCTKVSPGCANCFAERMARRLKGAGLPQYQNVVGKLGWTGTVSLVEDALDKPLSWRKPKLVFPCSMGDLFHEEIDVLDPAFRAEAFAVMALAQQHTFQVLTKRAHMLRHTLTDGFAKRVQWNADVIANRRGMQFVNVEWPLPNAWIGVTVEDQRRANERIPYLVQTPAAVRFLSIEPMLEPVDLVGALFQPGVWDSIYPGHGGLAAITPSAIADGGIGWVIIGCETGPGRRPCRVEWVRDLVQQCQAAGVPVFVKALDLDGRVSKDPTDWPADLRVRQYPDAG
jgi:protein gp37